MSMKILRSYNKGCQLSSNYSYCLTLKYLKTGVLSNILDILVWYQVSKNVSKIVQVNVTTPSVEEAILVY